MRPNDKASSLHELQGDSSDSWELQVTGGAGLCFAVIFYDLFKVVNRRLALLDVFFIVVATAIEAAALFNEFAPLVLLSGGPYTSALPAAQLQALAYMPGELSAINYTIYTVFYGCDFMPSGIFWHRSLQPI